jgi:hypothetical protein
MRKVGFIVLLLVALAFPAFGQDLGELARQRIAEQTGLDQDLIATLFVSEENAQFILTFIYINERTFDSRLNPELLEAIAPYRQREAVLVLVTPTQESYFSPLLVSFSQDRFTYEVKGANIRGISESFLQGTLPKGEVSAGVILLDSLGSNLGPRESKELEVSDPFKITYSGQYSTVFALSSGERHELGLESGWEGFDILDLFQFFYLIFALLLPFLLLA